MFCHNVFPQVYTLCLWWLKPLLLLLAGDCLSFDSFSSSWLLLLLEVLKFPPSALRFSMAISLCLLPVLFVTFSHNAPWTVCVFLTMERRIVCCTYSSFSVSFPFERLKPQFRTVFPSAILRLREVIFQLQLRRFCLLLHHFWPSYTALDTVGGYGVPSRHFTRFASWRN